MKLETLSPKQQKKRAKKAAESLAAEHTRLISRIRNLFEIEGWSTERIAEAVELPRCEVIRLIQTSTLANPEAQQ